MGGGASHAEFILAEDEQFNRIKSLLPNKPRGVPRVDDRRVLSGIIFCLKRGYRWSDVPMEYGPAKTLYNRYKRWSEMRVFEQIFETLAREGTDLKTLMIDASHVKTHRIAANGVKKSPPKEGASARRKAA
jgi:transposase